MGERPQSGDGLVMPEAFPCKSENINVENIKSASSKLKSMGQTIDSRMDTIVGLVYPGCMWLRKRSRLMD